MRPVVTVNHTRLVCVCVYICVYTHCYTRFSPCVLVVAMITTTSTNHAESTITRRDQI